ncbi:bifunctional serine/threonine-protein kinase/glutamate ABC transporter substrate-binding protein [Actinacidiphila oryziradicis]|jgi:serine/threonine protein kinase|uniref:bifunctional serine/threonine-protein kinase/glutamate ABC transporter substrate-binding protein n=1 Tax=Actinacidiphila oryziradicis TaxID=2571141 RepID=UPI0023F24055|nr:bifunctional serine/threonine-protein kinase/glutamate ABC transporter substrate-binding protein [Actinacidiphila oryziradicis]MCW2869094.1 serine/threonine protein kinase [Actinacidiphila oryziradicis]
MTTGGMPHTLIDGRYELQRQLGRGGMGVVWEAYDNRLGRQVAVKELLFRGAMDPETQAQWVSRARREAQAIARIGHEHVVAVHDVIEAEGQVWIVMEQVDPHSLADRLREQGRLPALQAARIGLEVLRGLRAVHAAGVLHRDVKPHNILFRRDGRAVLMDFGIATFEGAAQVTRLHETVGTPQYLAPELTAPSSDRTTRDATPAADLWSLGVTLYETVEGRAPFRGPTPYEVLEAVRTLEVPPMGHAGPLRPLIEGLLVKEPAARLTSERAEQLLQHVAQETPHPLARYPEDGETQSTPSPPPTGPDSRTSPAAPPRPARPLRFRRPRRSRRLIVLAGAAAVAVLLTAGWFGLDRLRDPGRPSLSDSATIVSARQRGFLIVGVKSDQPGLSERTGPGTNDFKGFDIDLARAIAKRLGFKEVHFEVVDTPSREYRLSSGQVDLIVASYSITAQREKSVDFAGPYYTAGQDFLVRAADKKYTGVQSLTGHKVCTVQGSTSETRLRDVYPGILRDSRASYGLCVSDLLTGVVDAVSTDDVILAGYRAQYPKALRLLGAPFSEEEYGVGLHKDEPELKQVVCEVIKEEISSGRWRKSYDRYLKRLAPKELGDQRPPEQTQCG